MVLPDKGWCSITSVDIINRDTNDREKSGKTWCPFQERPKNHQNAFCDTTIGLLSHVTPSLILSADWSPKKTEKLRETEETNGTVGTDTGSVTHNPPVDPQNFQLLKEPPVAKTRLSFSTQNL